MATDIRPWSEQIFRSAPQPIPGRADLPLVPADLVTILNEIGSHNEPINLSTELEAIHEESAMASDSNPKIRAEEDSIIWNPRNLTISGVLQYLPFNESDQVKRLAFTSKLETTCSSIGSISAVSGVDVRLIGEYFGSQDSKIEALAESIVHDWLNSPADLQSAFLVKERLRQLL